VISAFFSSEAGWGTENAQALDGMPDYRPAPAGDCHYAVPFHAGLRQTRQIVDAVVGEVDGSFSFVPTLANLQQQY